MDLSAIIAGIVEEMRTAPDRGTVASYIPSLAQIDPAQFGIAIVTADGETFTGGDAETGFSIQSISKVFSLTLALGVALAGIGGALMAPLFNVYPAVGFPLTIKAFAITILGGMGNLAGALIASLVIGVTESLVVMVVPSQWQNGVAFAVMIAVLLFRPQGLLGRPSTR